MSNLQLSLKTKWFEMTKSGVKTEDYREITPYWIRRLTLCEKGEENVAINILLKGKEYVEEYYKNVDWKESFCFPKVFLINTMTLGYPKSSDTERILKLEHKGIEIRTGNPDWGAEPDKLYFVILHGSAVE